MGRSRHPAVEFFSDTIAKFGSFVTRDDPRQALIDKFVGEFNAIPRVMRVEDVIKDEVHVHRWGYAIADLR